MAVKIVIGKLRTKKGLTQEEFAKAMDMSLGGVQYLECEAKAINIELMDDICEVLECEPGDLFARLPNSEKDLEAKKKRRELRKKKSKLMKQRWEDKRNKQTKDLMEAG